MNNEYPPKIEALFDRAIELQFTEKDFAELAAAAMDQAMDSTMLKLRQRAMAKLLTTQLERHGYHLTDAEAMDVAAQVVMSEVSPDGSRCSRCDCELDARMDLCEACVSSLKRIKAHERLRAIEDGRGDYEREQQIERDREHPDYDTNEEKDMDRQ